MSDQKTEEIAPDVTLESGDQVELILAESYGLAVAFTPVGVRIVIALNGRNYALTPAAWNEMCEGLERVTRKMGMAPEVTSMVAKPGYPSANRDNMAAAAAVGAILKRAHDLKQ